MPCTAKIWAQRQEMNDSAKYWKINNLRDVDIVLTTRELARMLKQNIDLTSLPDENYDSLMGEDTGAAIIFSATGRRYGRPPVLPAFLVTGMNP